MIEFDKTTRDSMLKEAIFLETYERQADMDFQVFGVSLGGISVTKSSPLVEHDREQIDFAYSADCTDQYLYPLLLESQKIDLLGDLAPVLVITGKDSDPSDRNKLLSHLFPVLEYFAGTAPISGVGVEDTVPDIDDDYTEDEDDEFYNTPDRVSPHL